ncbi:MAG: hypothetical protein ACRDKI_05850 [Solirubrobacterales bacterium]
MHFVGENPLPFQVETRVDEELSLFVFATSAERDVFIESRPDLEIIRVFTQLSAVYL